MIVGFSLTACSGKSNAEAKSLYEQGLYRLKSRVQKGVACHVLPGIVELNVTISWTKSYYVARKHGSTQAHFRFEAAPGHSYAAVFNVAESKAHIISLDAK